MSYTPHTAYGDVVNAGFAGVKGLLTRFHDVSELARTGVGSIPGWTAPTATDIAESTAVANAANNTQVTLTYVDYQVTRSLEPHQMRALDTNPQAAAAWGLAVANAFTVLAQNAIVAALKAATPGQTQTLTIGQVDFVTDGTAAEAYLNLKAANYALSYVIANNQQMTMDDISIIVPPAVWAYFSTLVDSTVGNSFRLKNDGPFTYMNGVPIFSVTGATSFGSAANECMFVVPRDAVAFAWGGVEVQGGGYVPHYDAVYKLVTVCPFGYAVLTNGGKFSQVVNPAS